MTVRVAFRVDASSRMGSGHVMRCLSLAAVLRERGANVHFVCRAHPGHLNARIIAAGFAISELPAPPHSDSTREDYAEWLGVPQEWDAAQTLDVLRHRPADWLVVDHYGLGAEWQRALRAAGPRILVIDDLANRVHESDVLLDQNYAGAGTAARYDGLVPDHCRRLLGPRYALLQPDYARLRALLPPRDGTVRRVLVFFGGSDPTGATLRVVNALDAPGLDSLALDVVLGSADPTREAVRTLLARRAAATLHGPLPGLAGLMARADLAIGATGGTTWERACLGLPSAVVTIAENQHSAAARLADDGYHVCLGRSADVSVDRWRTALSRLVADAPRLRALSARVAGLTDGTGAQQVADALLAPRISVGATSAAGGPRLRVSLLSDASSWLNPYLVQLADAWRASGHVVHSVNAPADLPHGDVCFVIGCSQLIRADVRARHAYNLVVHESAVPQGRGWSPMTWQVLEDRRVVTVSLFEAVERVDAGAIHLQTTINLQGTELIDEWRELQAQATATLCTRWLASYPEVARGAREQQGEPSYYPRRGPADSRLDPDAPLSRNFDLLRVVDNDRYPAWFECRGRRFRLSIHRDERDPSVVNPDNS